MVRELAFDLGVKGLLSDEGEKSGWDSDEGQDPLCPAPSVSRDGEGSGDRPATI